MEFKIIALRSCLIFVSHDAGDAFIITMDFIGIVVRSSHSIYTFTILPLLNTISYASYVFRKAANGAQSGSAITYCLQRMGSSSNIILDYHIS